MVNMKLIEKKTMQVVFSFGSVATVTINVYEGKTLDECVKMRGDIDGYILNGKYIKVN